MSDGCLVMNSASQNGGVEWDFLLLCRHIQKSQLTLIQLTESRYQHIDQQDTLLLSKDFELIYLYLDHQVY
jgi:hypothetical protein